MTYQDDEVQFGDAAKMGVVEVGAAHVAEQANKH
jgi:hypothetical protein